ncbi:M28 family metallopeptidase [Anaerolinea thermophila]|uniref:Peptidase M28 domain-containing protein n=1 Tax=Anaerolinea thermophila (strain DSM 14523 / JCM 11388 / NBRC 100420 / UNI-1) TaxID=926569 RepID=E8N068_ANATU|nr:M28 family peptidase [Anaerolinea thermophila]BAJ62403.1 hypothetical protein ANT_03690 [Anaerolinea thermophila UNI-1]
MNIEDARRYLKMLCEDIPDRSVGSEGNRRAVAFFTELVSSFGWQTETMALPVIDWQERGADLRIGEQSFDVRVSPYSLGCAVEAPLISAETLKELERLEVEGRVLLLHGELTREKLMPKNFPFYNPEEHQRILALLGQKQPAALICATGRNAAVAGGVYPFPLIEDGDFDIPSVFTTEEAGQVLLSCVGKTVWLESRSNRIPAFADQVIARKGNNPDRRVVVSAHIDAKKGSPGTIDNAIGVVVLLFLAELLKEYHGDPGIELVPFNGEDYYAATGQMEYLRKNQGRFHTIWLNINLDGVGYKDGKTALSFFNLPESVKMHMDEILARYEGLVEGFPWVQGDHSIFIQQGCPAVAVISQWLLEHLDSQEITHTSKDAPSIVDPHKLVEIAVALKDFLNSLSELN